MKKQLALASLVVMLTVSACGEQQNGTAHAPAETGMNGETDADTAMKSEMKADPSNPYMASEMEMHDKMMAAQGANAAETWTRKMIEHHKGALTMSQVALKETDDAMVRQMAQKTIDMQTKEIAELQKMLTDEGKARQGTVR